MFYVLDRVENNVAVMIDDNDTVVTVCAEELQGEWEEGTVFVSQDGIFSPDHEETELRRAAAAAKFRNLFK